MSRKNQQTAQPKIVHKEFKIKEAIGKDGLTAEEVMTLIGWEEQPENVEWPEGRFNADVSSCFPRKVNMKYNRVNRPFYPGVMKNLAQEQLNKRWAGPNGLGGTCNGDTIVISEYGNFLEGQHRAIALIYAEYCRKGLIEPGKAAHWKEIWPEPIKIDTILVYGVSETDALFRTLNTGKPATFGDTQYRAEWLREYGAEDRKKLSRAASYAVKLLWDRTGAGENSYEERKTLSSMNDFLERHPRLREVVLHLYKENENNAITKYIPLGYASALFYMMAACNTDSVAYHAARRKGEASEEIMDLSQWDKAHAFWVAWTSGVKEFAALRNAKRPIGGTRDARGIEKDRVMGSMWKREIDGEVVQPRSSLAEQIACICNAWRAFKDGRNPTEANLRLDYLAIDADDGIIENYKLNDATAPIFGGIDRGEDIAKAEAEEAEKAKEEIEAERENEQGGKPVEDETPDQEKARRLKIIKDAAERAAQKKLDEAAAAAKGRKPGRQVGEVKSEGEVEYDADGKPPAPAFKPKANGKLSEKAQKHLAGIASLKDAHDGAIILFNDGDGYIRAWDKDAEALADTLGLDKEAHPLGLFRVGFTEDELDSSVDTLLAAGFRVCMAEKGQSGAVVVRELFGSEGPPVPVTDDEPAEEEEEKPAPKGKGKGKKTAKAGGKK